MYDAVVFDMDGVLVERSPGWVFAEAATAAFEAFDLDPETDDTEALRSLAGGEDGEARRLEQRHGVSAESLWATREGLAAVNQVRAIEAGEKAPYDAAVEAVEALDLPMGVVSNNSQQAVETVLRRFGFHDHLRTWYGLQPTLADARHSKPDPTYLRRALSDLDAESAVYVGDRATDVAAADNAGIDSAFVHRPFNEDEDPDPTYELESLAELPAVVDADC